MSADTANTVDEGNKITGNAIGFSQLVSRMRDEISRAVIGNAGLVDGMLCCLFSGGHCLVEGVPGLGKTLLCRVFAKVCGVDFGRVQFTPDLMPADITGSDTLQNAANGPEVIFRKGPVFTSLLLADEINRATPKTQSALLEAMQEGAVTSAGTRRKLPEPFMVLATQNPLEMSGTYPLPEAQLDRFMLKISANYPARGELQQIINLDCNDKHAEDSVQAICSASEIMAWRKAINNVLIPEEVMDYTARLTLATAPANEYACNKAKEFIRYGASPRGALAMARAARFHAFSAGRSSAGFDDIAATAADCLRHRLTMNFEAIAENISAEETIADALSNTPQSI